MLIQRSLAINDPTTILPSSYQCKEYLDWELVVEELPIPRISIRTEQPTLPFAFQDEPFMYLNRQSYPRGRCVLIWTRSRPLTPQLSFRIWFHWKMNQVEKGIHMCLEGLAVNDTLRMPPSLLPPKDQPGGEEDEYLSLAFNDALTPLSMAFRAPCSCLATDYPM